jgi:hypothetical protein
MKKCIINKFACFLLLLIPLMLVSMTLCQIEGVVVDYHCVADVDSNAVCVVGPHMSVLLLYGFKNINVGGLYTKKI